MTYFNSPRMTHFPKMEYFNLWAQQLLISWKLNYFNFDTPKIKYFHLPKMPQVNLSRTTYLNLLKTELFSQNWSNFPQMACFSLPKTTCFHYPKIVHFNLPKLKHRSSSREFQKQNIFQQAARNTRTFGERRTAENSIGYLQNL